MGTQTKVHDFLKDSAHAAFRWGVHDCGLFAANCYRHVHGFDLMHGLRTRYRSPQGAAKLLKEMGGYIKLAESRFEKHGIVRVDRRMATTGAIGFVKQPKLGWTAGIFDGRDWLFAGMDGLTRYPAKMVERAYQRKEYE